MKKEMKKKAYASESWRTMGCAQQVRVCCVRRENERTRERKPRRLRQGAPRLAPQLIHVLQTTPDLLTSSFRHIQRAPRSFGRLGRLVSAHSRPLPGMERADARTYGDVRVGWKESLSGGYGFGGAPAALHPGRMVPHIEKIAVADLPDGGYGGALGSSGDLTPFVRRPRARSSEFFLSIGAVATLGGRARWGRTRGRSVAVGRHPFDDLDDDSARSTTWRRGRGRSGVA